MITIRPEEIPDLEKFDYRDKGGNYAPTLYPLQFLYAGDRRRLMEKTLDSHEALSRAIRGLKAGKDLNEKTKVDLESLTEALGRQLTILAKVGKGLDQVLTDASLGMDGFLRVFEHTQAPISRDYLYAALAPYMREFMLAASVTDDVFESIEEEKR